jgi:uncharacterized protein YecT (DUF1311 family)
MRCFFATIICLLLAGKSYSQNTPKVNCENPQTQADMNYCAGKDFEKADQELNLVYRQVIAQLDPGSRQLLITAQKNWIAVRDNHCAVYKKLYAGGSIMPLMLSTCKTELTQNRIKELEGLLKDLEEGNK